MIRFLYIHHHGVVNWSGLGQFVLELYLILSIIIAINVAIQSAQNKTFVDDLEYRCGASVYFNQRGPNCFDDAGDDTFSISLQRKWWLQTARTKNLAIKFMAYDVADESSRCFQCLSIFCHISFSLSHMKCNLSWTGNKSCPLVRQRNDGDTRSNQSNISHLQFADQWEICCNRLTRIKPFITLVRIFLLYNTLIGNQKFKK